MQVNIEGELTGQESYFFEAVANKVLQEKDTKELLTKWGLFESLKIGTFRYNQVLRDFEMDRFIRDLFNNPNVRFTMQNIPFKQEAIGSVEHSKLRCNELTLELFDQLETEGIVKKGHISKMMTEYYEEIEVADRLRQCLLLEESEFYTVFSEAQRKQFLLRLMQLLVVGGSFNQYEDTMQAYLELTKKIYKSLVSVRKRLQTKQLFIESLVYEVKSMDEGKSFKTGSHPQNVLYVIVNPSIRTVHVLTNEWKKFW